MPNNRSEVHNRNHLPLVVRDLSYCYGQLPDMALNQLSFQVLSGEIVLIAGSSGSGKTTLVRCLNGLIPHSYRGGQRSGDIRIFGEEPAALSLAEISGMVGSVLQDPEKQIVASYVANEIAFGLENLGVERAEMRRRIRLVLDRLGIVHLHDRETFRLSHGEKQKLVLGSTLVLEPAILLLDEPLASLDAYGTEETLSLIRHLADQGKTVLIVEHRLERILKLRPDKVLFLVNGEQHYFGDVAGFLAMADPSEVKLPAHITLQRLHKLGAAVDTAEGPKVDVRPKVDVPPIKQAFASKPATPLIHYENVSFSYEPDDPILQEINFSLFPGDVVAVLGPNGAGKTTLAKLAVGLLRPNRGRVYIGGRDNKTMTVAQIARVVGYVFQSPRHMLFAPTIEREVAFGMHNLGFDEVAITSAVPSVLKAVDLTAYMDLPPLALSFGQQKRLTIAAVMAMQSRVLVLDEPTAGQDFRHYTKLMERLLRLLEGDARDDVPEAMVLISHDLDFALSYANRVILLRAGRILADGPPHEVLARRDLLAMCRLQPSSLLELNLQLLPHTGRLMPANMLSRYIPDLEELRFDIS